MRDFWVPLAEPFRSERDEVQLGSAPAFYGQRCTSVEAFGRVLWGLASLESGGGKFSEWPLLRSILAAGTASGGGWGIQCDFDPRSVEAPPIALALCWAREALWEPLTENERTTVVAWLSRINEVKLSDNNWRWFRVLTNAALRALGQPWSRERLQEDIAIIDDLWRDDGWYSDGLLEQRDYYVPMAMHFYGLIFSRLAAAGEERFAAACVERARRFAVDFQHWFAADGAAIPFGRSLHYRFAQGAFWSALAFASVEALPWGLVKGLLLRHLRWWMQRPILTDGGRLSLGYGYAQPHLAEGYGSAAGPLWALKALLVLALPEEHPFWRTDEAPLPTLPAVVLQLQPRMIVCRDDRHHHVFSLSSNATAYPNFRHAAAKYAKFAYSSAFAFSIPAGCGRLDHGAFDSMLALTDDERQWRVRERSEQTKISDDVIYARWHPWDDVEIETWLMPVLPGHLRVHRLVSQRALKSFEGGFAVGRIDRADTEQTVGVDRAVAVTSIGASAVLDAGTHLSARGVVVETEPSTNLLHPIAVLPGIERSHSAGEVWLYSAVVGIPRAAAGELAAFLAEFGTRENESWKRFLEIVREGAEGR